ncbi:transcriptional regulator, partial [Streptomyces sp. NPDC057621]|uniref:MmyB family transcriptional regulator n=1 Tax=Streptomyces sp. NPDC057621 TaxID=3346186 RepID=UPI0036928761
HFDLARKRRPDTAVRPATTAAPTLARLVEDLSPLPAMVLNHRYDIVAWNREMAGLLVDFATLPPARRNSMWMCLMHPQTRELYVDRERVVREGAAHLRAAWAAYPGDRVLNDLIAEFSTHDERFARAWAERDVKIKGRGRKVMRHPEAGEIAVDFEVLTPIQDLDQRVVIYRPADDESRSAMGRLPAR